jgi:magnesium-dependent phosphatase 1
MRIAAASSADTPLAVRIAKASLSILEVYPGVTMRVVFNKGFSEGFEGNIQIGRIAPLSSRKELTHFPILQEETGVEYSKMLFFDDCNWTDHVGNVSMICKGVVGIRTPNGLKHSEWQSGLQLFRDR